MRVLLRVVILFGAVLFARGVSFAVPVSEDLAAQVAAAQMKAMNVLASDSVEYTMSVTHRLEDPELPDALGFVFELVPTGYIVVSGDTRISPVIAYSEEAAFSWLREDENILLGMVELDLKLRAQAVDAVSTSSDPKLIELVDHNQTLWDLYAAPGELTDTQHIETTYGPMLQFPTWHQSSPYWNDCPMDPVTGSRCVVGCVATALAQIINYWRYPSSVTFLESDSYTTTTREIWVYAPNASISYIAYSADPSTNPSTTTCSALSFACGVSARMNYTSSSSGASLSILPSALLDDWSYATAVRITSSASDFYDRLRQNMQALQPAELGIRTADWVYGHAIVCDGYRTQDGFYHLNYGWGGTSDGWYSLPSGMPSGYSIVSEAVLDITPEGDGTAPIPNPMTWSAVPHAAGAASIAMTATTASDPNGVEYYFDETTGNPGATDSGWQDSPTYQDSGLQVDTQYCYRVKARDKSANQNDTAYSSSSCTNTNANPPDIGAAPSEMTATVAPETVQENALQIQNTGDSDLLWSIELRDIQAAGTEESAPVTVTEEPVLINCPKEVEGGSSPFGATAAGPGQHTAISPQGADGPDGGGYRWIDSHEPGGPTYDWVDITTTGTPILLWDDSALAGVSLAFSFPFYGESMSAVDITSNGYIGFQGVSTYSYCTNDPIPDTGVPNGGLVCPFWDDLNPGIGGAVYYRSEADRFIVSWIDVPHFANSGSYTFQAILYSDGSIKYQYQSMGNGEVTNSATVGIENATGTDGLEVVYNADYVENGLAVLITPASTWIDVAPRSGTTSPDGSASVAIILDATGLSDGDVCTCDLVIVSNDPDEAEVMIPVTMDVGIAHPDTPSVFRVENDGAVSADRTFHANAFQSGSADVAEWVLVSEAVATGDVLELDPDNPGYCRVSQTMCSPHVTGVVSTKPGVTLGNALASYEDKAILALVGMVPVNVTNEGGSIRVGDLLVSSSTPGAAMRWAGEGACPCALVGKALEPMTDETGVILVLLTAH